jgi:hypothetical protein
LSIQWANYSECCLLQPDSQTPVHSSNSLENAGFSVIQCVM